jgi:hypothetical protein
MIQILDADTSKVLMSFKPVLDTNDGVRIYRPEPDPAVRIGRSYNTMQPSELDLGLGPTDAVPNWVLHTGGSSLNIMCNYLEFLRFNSSRQFSFWRPGDIIFEKR